MGPSQSISGSRSAHGRPAFVSSRFSRGAVPAAIGPGPPRAHTSPAPPHTGLRTAAAPRRSRPARLTATAAQRPGPARPLIAQRQRRRLRLAEPRRSRAAVGSRLGPARHGTASAAAALLPWARDAQRRAAISPLAAGRGCGALPGELSPPPHPSAGRSETPPGISVCAHCHGTKQTRALYVSSLLLCRLAALSAAFRCHCGKEEQIQQNASAAALCIPAINTAGRAVGCTWLLSVRNAQDQQFLLGPRSR